MITNPTACDYALASEDADFLKAVSLLPSQERRDLLSRYKQRNGLTALLDVFAQFIGLANSVVTNNREMAELLLITEGGCTERTAESAHLPTIFGALHGAELANQVERPKALCEGCAFRLGTPANQSPITTCDASWSAETDDRFMCHVRGLDDDGEPTRLCAGYAAITKETS
jgi:hypothetical protein